MRFQQSGLVCLVLLLLSLNAAKAESKGPRLGISFPPVSNAKARAITLRHLKRLNCKLVRIDAPWRLREPRPGKYNWKPFDARVKALRSIGVDIMVTLSADGPDWVSGKRSKNGRAVFKDAKAWRRFVSAFVSRYSKHIHKLQFANEWDSLGYWFPGTAQELVHLHNIFYETSKAIAPDLTIVLGGVTRSYPMLRLYTENPASLDFSKMKLKEPNKITKKLEKGRHQLARLKARVEHVFANAQYDECDIHLYDDCENWSICVDVIRTLTSRPIIVSEFGGPSSNYEVYSEDYHGQRIKAYLQVISKLPITEAYYFNLVENPTTYHDRSGLLTRWLREKSAYRVFREFLKE